MFSAKKLRMLIANSNMQKQDVAGKLGTSKAMLWKYLEGKATPRPARVDMMAELFCVDVKEFYENADDSSAEDEVYSHQQADQKLKQTLIEMAEDDFLDLIGYVKGYRAGLKSKDKANQKLENQDAP